MAIIHKDYELFDSTMDYSFRVRTVPPSNKIHLEITAAGQVQDSMCIAAEDFLEFMAHVTEALNM